MKRTCELWIIPAVFAAVIFTSRASAENLRTGTSEGKLTHDGLARTYLLHLPPKYDGQKPLPLVVFLHGGGGAAKQAAEHYGFREKADAENFIVVYPDGAGRVVHSWNAMHGCGSAFRNKVDDVGFVRELLAKLGREVKFDPKRVYATGMSNGAMLTHRLAAEMPEVFAAVAPVAGSIGGKEDAQAEEKRIPVPKSPVPIVIVHGKEDTNVPYEGGQSQGLERNRIDLSVAEAVRFWIAANKCSEKAERTEDGNVIKETYGSTEGNDVVLYTVTNGGHAWPGMARRRKGKEGGMNATDAIWEFFAAHAKR